MSIIDHGDPSGHSFRDQSKVQELDDTAFGDDISTAKSACVYLRVSIEGCFAVHNLNSSKLSVSIQVR